MGAIDEFSIGYVTLQSENQKFNGSTVRALIELDVKEISLVTFACNPESKIESVKSAVVNGDAVTPRMVQKCLQESGLSKRQAETAINQITSKAADVAETEVKEESEMTEKTLEQKATKPVAEVKSKNMEQKADWWMRDTLADPIISIDCLMNAFYFLPATTIAAMVELAEAGRKVQLAALAGDSTEEKSKIEIEAKAETDMEEDTEEKEFTTDVENEEDTEEKEFTTDVENEEDTEEKTDVEENITEDEVKSWFK